MASKYRVVNAVSEGESQGSLSLAAVLAAIRNDVQEFAQTRFQLFKAEVREKSKAWKAAGINFSIALVFGIATFLLITATLVSLIAIFLGAFVALLIVTFLYLCIAGIAAWAGYQKVKSKPLLPERTLEVLKEDRTWLQNQTRRT